MAVSHLSFVIASKFPRQLAEFYALLTDSDCQNGFSSHDYFVVHAASFRIHIYNPSSVNPFPERGRVITLCLNSEPNSDPMRFLEEWLRILISRGASLVERPADQFFGAEAWMQDPEGNNFLVFVPKY